MSSPAHAANELEATLLELFAKGVDAPLPEEEFNRLALAVFAHQFTRNGPYGAFCRARGRTPDTITRWEEIPAVPTNAFKHADLTTVPPEQVTVTYQTSGTTGGSEVRGRHLLPNTRLYNASLEPNFRTHLLPDCEAIRILVCGPTSRYFPHSSLGHMHSFALDKFGAPGSGIFWTDEGPRFPCLLAALTKADEAGEPVALLGTAFGFVHFLDWMEGQGKTLRLAPGSRLMDTGGYKGRSREVPKPELYAAYEERFGMPLTYVVNEYGMTEMGSQFYDRVLRDAHSGGQSPIALEQRWKTPPPWARTQVVDPETLAPQAAGSVGLLRHFDLANLHTVSAIQTDDLGVLRGDGFEVLGRATGAELRGCSLAVEEYQV